MQTDYAAYWNDHARKVGHREAVTPLTDQEYRELYLDELKQLGPEVPKRILDYGCGPALLLPIVRQLWPEADYHGVDVSEEMIRHCQLKHQDNSIFHKLPDYLMIQDSWDFLICHSIFTHIRLEDAIRLLRELHSLITPGGVASISILDEPLDSGANFQGCLERVDYNKQFFEGMLVQAGFSIEKTYRRHQMFFGVRKI